MRLEKRPQTFLGEVGCEDGYEMVELQLFRVTAVEFEEYVVKDVLCMNFDERIRVNFLWPIQAHW